ncbi:hypothetical protein KDH_72210 [Dictyobacter sp. S3.2.2.5]|uniref:DUF2970 domain-containing protein n=1 Tax=Dictyobacter halimunensis TaxID=3026934 RepID=A0ABQ6G549_9CHLR|nr:hypothetical protein KDH_72210 [Dictyobacter sp. S3.2.2.5]
MQPDRALKRVKRFVKQQQRYRFTLSLDNGKTTVEAPTYAVALLLGVVLFVLGTFIKILIENAID